MKTSILAMANKHNPQPLPKRSIDSCVTPAQINLAKHHTLVTKPGDITMANIFSPGARKLVTNGSPKGQVRIIGQNTDNVDLKKHDSWTLMENAGDEWVCIHVGRGAVRCKNRRKSDG